MFITMIISMLIIFSSPLKASCEDNFIERFEKREEVMEVHFPDVKNGEVSIIRLPKSDKVFVIDTGSPEENKTIVDYLEEIDVNTIDALIITNPYSNYIGGAPKIIDRFDVKKTIDSGTALKTNYFRKYLTAATKETDFHIARRGDELYQSEIAKLEIIYPEKILFNDPRENSLVLHLQYGQINFLFTGGLGLKGEQRLNFDQNIDILKIARMGDTSGTSGMFLESIEPEVGVILGGSDNKRNLPKQELLEKLDEKNIHIERTGQSGTIIFRTNGQKINWNL
ncbi:hydrolase of metallo-beta-lactamase fold [Natranaerobius thermophilus JW/NM-WN-LF]|uniref:Hydrolase of metallo-beta-lactamase fold n=1 Tax=Natranaerobius thermophilus (strain ATCC BAA-1301 / DSM 18059 / JW/NM-WN-LF) TaxID=457570 RepID=B2A4J7_NATTJ|nr:hydrolase of metallo-beta-lactamase fold [Natranaerobius thermophilus JW/NM-WN-LF]